MALPQDARLAVRLFRRTPLTTGIALFSIALSVGATAVAFTAVKSVLLDPLPFAKPAELVQFRSEFPGVVQQSAGDWIVWNDARELDRRARGVGPLGVFANAVLDLAGDANFTPEALYGVRVNAALFDVLGARPMLGRNILPEEDRPGHPDVVVLSYGLWERRFHRDRSIVGRAITVNGHACLVIGLMPERFNFPMRREAVRTPVPYVQFWAAPLLRAANPDAGMGAVARLRAGATLEAARQEAASISRDLAREFPATNRDRILTVSLLRDRTAGAAGNRLWLLMAAAALFLLIGCANVANLLLARGLARGREMAIRLAIGARPAAIVRQLLTESCVLALAGGLGGYLLAAAAWRVLPAVAPISIPRLAAARADTAVLAFSLGLAVVNGVLFGMAPALRLSGCTGLPRKDRVRPSLVVAEVAVAVLLVVTGGQVLASFVRLLAADPGFTPDRVLASIVLPASERYPKPEQRGAFYRRMLDAVRAIPGVESAGTVDALPFTGENHGGFVHAGGAQLIAEIDVAGGDYLQSMGIRLAEGRLFRDEDSGPSSDTAIVNTHLARRLWPATSAIGQRVCVFCTPESPDNWKRVIGVVESARHAALDGPEIGNVYLAANAMEGAQFLVARTAHPGVEMEKAIRRAIAAVDPDQPVLLSASMRELIGDSIADRRFVILLLAATACLALVMSAAGVYGVVSYTTSRRTQEIGIRMAIGATPENVFTLIFRQGFTTVGAGLVLGLVGALASIRMLRSLPLGLESLQPLFLWAAAALVTAAAAIACWIPARRATRTEPAIALRRE